MHFYTYYWKKGGQKMNYFCNIIVNHIIVNQNTKLQVDKLS